MYPVAVPGAVWRAAGIDPGTVASVEVETFGDGTGAASDRVELVTSTLESSASFSLVRKTFGPLTSGPHADAAQSSDHWAYWRRELLAYQSGLLPTGPDFRAPRLYGVVDDTLYVEYLRGSEPTARNAARALGHWHGATASASASASPEAAPWLARDQLAQRIAATSLDWSSVRLDRRLGRIWERRVVLLEELSSLPTSIAHGDYSLGNLRTDGQTVVSLDWATLGVSPVGFDLAHLALSTGDGSLVSVYQDALRGSYPETAVALGYRLGLGLVGTSRAHWMASRGIDLPAGYSDFVIENSDLDVA